MVAVKANSSRARRIGRRIGIAVFALIVGGATATWTVQILLSVFAPPVLHVARECPGGTRGLLSAVRRARLAAAAESGDERAALARFRAALEPEWSTRTSLDSLCKDEPKAMAALNEIDALRYAEEHAVRYEAVGLARQRRQFRPCTSSKAMGRRAPPFLEVLLDEH